MKALPGARSRHLGAAKMGALGWTALLLAVLLLGRGCSGSSVHSLRYFIIGVSEPGQGLPSFTSAGCVDGQCFVHYDSHTRRQMPAAPWMEKVTQEDPQYWDRETQILQGWEADFRRHLATLQDRYNQSAGLHTWQNMHGCDLSGDQPSGGHYQFGYEGRDFIAFDKETLTWTATDAAPQITKRKWEAEPAFAQARKNYLENICIEWLRRYLRYGKETLLRKEPPVVKVTRKDSQDGLETLLCQAHGFYPKEIDITWRKDGVVRQEDTFHGVVSPNVDGTYYTWLSIEVDPKDQNLYQCHVEHDGLEVPLDVNVEKSGFDWLIGVVVGVVVAVILAVVGAVIYFKKRAEKQNPAYKQTSTSDQGSDSSARDSPSLHV